ncbi:MAG: abortive infection family protein [Methanosarcina sp.]
MNYLEQEETIPSDESISRTMKEISWDNVNSTWEKTLERRKTDPEGAVTASKTLLEDVCKCILDESCIVYSSTASLPELCDKALTAIELHPSQQSESSIKKLTGLCNSGCSVISEFRNKYGDSHGKGIKKEKPELKHVEFVINLSGTIAKLMIEKWDEMKTA